MERPGPCSWTEVIDAASDRTALARAGERIAAAHLVAAHGLEVHAFNLRVAAEGLRGELDVVLHDARSGLLVVCEVKSRIGAPSGAALEALGAAQQARIRRMTGVLLALGTLRATRVRFDLVTVEVSARRASTVAAVLHLPGAW